MLINNLSRLSPPPQEKVLAMQEQMDAIKIKMGDRYLLANNIPKKIKQ